MREREGGGGAGKNGWIIQELSWGKGSGSLGGGLRGVGYERTGSGALGRAGNIHLNVNRNPSRHLPQVSET